MSLWFWSVDKLLNVSASRGRIRTWVRTRAEDILAAYAELDAALDKVLGLSHDALTHPDLVVVLGRLERIVRRAPAVAHPMINRLVAEASPQALGGKSLADVLCIGLRISKSQATSRIADARELGPRTTVTGETLEPVLARRCRARCV